MKLNAVISLLAISAGSVPIHSEAALVVADSSQDEQGSGQGITEEQRSK